MPFVLLLAALAWIAYVLIARARHRDHRPQNKEESMLGIIDLPVTGEIVPPTGFVVGGWVLDGARRLAAVSARHAGVQIGATAVPYVRDDVEPGARCGYRIYVEPGPDVAPGDYDIEIVARFDDDPSDVFAGRLTCRLSTFDERTRDYGGLSKTDWTVIPHREHIYTVGPPSRACAPGLVDLLFSYIAPDATVLDVGCGAAPYATPFLESGRRWTGCELSRDLVDENRARGLPVTLVENGELPFETGSFEFALCIEVLEHIDEYDDFVAEIARVARRGACFSVPNARAIPRLAPFGVVPWHLLEGSHVNFFTTVNLREFLSGYFAHVETFEYGPLPLAAIDGTPIFNHVFAVAMHAPDHEPRSS